MKKQFLQHFLYEQIPLTKAQSITIERADDEGVTISAPLALNHNHMNTAFGGSLSSLLITACYTCLFHRMEEEEKKFHILIKKEETKYLLPVEEDIRVLCSLPKPEDYERFIETFRRKGLARITLRSQVIIATGTACEFTGEFVAQRS